MSSPPDNRSSLPGPKVVIGDAWLRQDSLLPAHAVDLHTTQPSLHPVDYRMFVVIDRAAYVGIFAHAAFIPLFFIIGVLPLAAFNVVSVVVWVLGRRFNRAYQQHLAVYLLVSEVVLHAILATAILGWDVGFHLYLVPLIPFLLFNDRLPRTLVIGGSVAILLVLVALRLAYHDVDYAFDPGLHSALTVCNLVVPVCTLGLNTYYYRRASVSREGRMERLASRDALTSLLNRRAMRERIEEEYGRVRREGSQFALVIGDIDHFKRINDTYGHVAGDDVLVELSRMLKRELRQQDIVARWGGEEYLMMLPGTDLEGAAAVTERLRQRIEERMLPCGDNVVNVTMTFGVAQVSAKKDIQQGIRDADEALYRGKTDGRNRVVCHGAG